jgi:CHAD domain-containing protein
MSEMIDLTLVAALDQRWQGYRSQLKVCQHEFSEAAVHDLRVGARRLLAALDIVRILDSQRGARKTRRILKKLLDDLDDLRDAQVMLLEMTKVTASPAGLQAFQEYLQQRGARFRLEARQGIQGSKASSLGRRIQEIRANLVQAAQSDGFSERLLQAVDQLYGRARRSASQVDTQRGTSIHRARIALKRFRYATEIVEPLLPAYPENYFKRMHRYQTAMGNIRDLEILLAALADFAKSLPPLKGMGLSDSELSLIRRGYERRHTELVAEYKKGPDELSTFWREAADRPFPWEMKNDHLHHPPRNRRPNDDLRGGAGRQPAPADKQRPPEDAPDRTWIEPVEGLPRPHTYKSLRPRGGDGEDRGKRVRA